jgi:hypothetical protein
MPGTSVDLPEPVGAFKSTRSMPEMPVAGEDHGHAGGVGGGDDFLVADGAAGLDAGGGSGVDGGLQAVGKGNMASEATMLPLRSSPASLAFQTAMREESTRLIWPAPMPSVRSVRA